MPPRTTRYPSTIIGFTTPARSTTGPGIGLRATTGRPTEGTDVTDSDSIADRRSSERRGTRPAAEPVVQREFEVRTEERMQTVDVTRRVAAVVAEAGVDEGVCSVYVPHATAAIV